MSCVRRWVSLAVLLACGAAVAQPKPADGVRSSAVKMPDGTVVFITKNPGDADPKIDGVLLSAAEYQALVEQAEKLKKAKDGAKPQPPGKVELRARVEPRGDRTIAAVTAVFTFRTVSPKTVVTLGCQRATATGAKASDGKTPVLTAGDDGFAVLVETAGDHTLTLDLEVAVTARGPKGEFGFEFGLPRAAITTFALDKPPADVKAVSVGTRSSEPFTAVKHTSAAITSFTSAFPLGPTDTLEVLWEPRAAAAAAELTADGDVTIRVDDTQVETVAKLKLRGPAKEWPLTLPSTAEVVVERIGKSSSPLTTPATAVKPADPNKPWVIRTPADGGDGWLVTVTVRTPRPAAADPKSRGPYLIGPFHLPTARHTGRVRVFAPPSVRVVFRPSADLRRQDLPQPADDDLVAVFGYSSSAVGRGWGEFDVRPLANVPRVRPHHKLTLTPTAWRLESTVRVTPPPRGEVEQMAVLLPAGWQGWEFGPDDQVESDEGVADPSGRRTITLRFVTPQKAAVDLRVFATHPLPAAGRQLTLLLPRFLQADERDTLVEVAGGDGWTVSAAGHAWDRGGSSADTAVQLRGIGREATGEFERGAAKVEVNWRPFRPELACDVRADVTVQDRQLAVQQSFRFRLTDGDTRPFRLTVPGDPIGLRWTPRLEPAGANEWVYRPPADAGKEVTLVAQYAVRVPPRADDADPVAVPLIHPMTVSSADTVVRVWGGGGRRAAGFAGDWRELAPELAADADSLPWFTLGSSELVPPALALTDWSAAAPVVVERGLVQATLGEDGGSRVRGRFLLRRWEGGHVDFDLPPAIGVEASVDGKRVDPVLLPGGARVVVPELKPGRGMVTVEVRVQLPATNTRFAGRVLTPPAPRQASYRTPVRWQVFGGPADVLAAVGGVNAEWRWGWKGYGFGPVPAESSADVENWFRSEVSEPARPAADGDTILLRQPAPWPLRAAVVPRPVAVLATSALAFAIVYGFVRLAGKWTGLVFVLLSAGVAAAVVWLPHPTAAVAAAGQPGVVLAAVVLAVRAGWLRLRRRSARPATFSAAPQPPSGTASGNGVPRPNGTPGSSPSDAVRLIGS